MHREREREREREKERERERIMLRYCYNKSEQTNNATLESTVNIQREMTTYG